MYAYFEDHIQSTRSDCTIQALSWMGHAPESASSVKHTSPLRPENSNGWTTNHKVYYREGWLATGNAKGVVGVTFTACHCKPNSPFPARTNYNLRGHRSEVLLAKWNEPYQKLATCDATGVIFVWIKHEGRWSIELINDRNSPVTDFCWSHDGRMALISYRDGFVLVGSVAGQRFWSSLLNLDGSRITCSLWSPDDLKVMFGTSNGQIILMSSAGAMISQVTVQEGVEITSMAWSCEKFNLNEQASGNPNSTSLATPSPTRLSAATGVKGGAEDVLAVCFWNGAIHIMDSCDDLTPKVILTSLTGVKMEWSNDGSLLAVTGFNRLPNLQCHNKVLFYTKSGHIRFVLDVQQQGKPVTSLTWGHLDKRLFLAVGCHVHTIRVIKGMAPLQGLCRRIIQQQVGNKVSVDKLPLPPKLVSSISILFSSTIKGYIPEPHKLREFVCLPMPGSERLHCTMIRYGDTESSRGHYTLYLEYLGGLIPLLKGKRASKIRPEFIIYDPKINCGERIMGEGHADVFDSSDSSASDGEYGSDSVVEGCGSPRPQRKKTTHRCKNSAQTRDAVDRSLDDTLYDDNLPESRRLVEVTSSIWGTKFKIRGIASFLPEHLGSVLYKTSLLHLQPRQMTISLLELVKSELGQQTSGSGQQSADSEDEADPPRQGADTSVAMISPETSSLITAMHPNSKLASAPSSLPSQSMRPAAKLEIRPLDASPPQRRSPSFKKRSLSPAEQNVPYTSSELLSEDVSKKPAASSILPASGLSMCSGIRELHTDNNSSTCVVQKAARRLQEACIASAGCGSSASQELSHWLVDEKVCQDMRFIDDDGVDDDEGAAGISSNTVRSHCRVSPDGITHLMRDVCINASLPFAVENVSKKENKGDDMQCREAQVLNQSSLAAKRRASLEMRSQGMLSNTSSLSASLPTSPVKKNIIRERAKKSMDLSSCVSIWFSSQNIEKQDYHANDRDTTCENYKNLETFQKARLNKKLRKARNHNCQNTSEESMARASSTDNSPKRKQTRKAPGAGLSHNLRPSFHIMHNKAPTWNENSQVYQLDFGGRVTQESAKNFQIELQGTQVMQFGRIESNAYTLDFQHPFSAIQAFAVALANVTQRLK